MKLNCKVIEDLLALYTDNVCSDESRKLVEEHLRECEKCRVLLDNMASIQITHIEKDELKKHAIIKKGFQKIHRRWLASLIMVFMLIPVTFLGILGYNEKHGEGIAFSNLDDIYRCYKHLRYIEAGYGDKAAQMVDFSQREYQLVDSVAHMTLEEYQKYMTERFAAKLNEYKKLGISIRNIHYDCAYRDVDNGKWSICLSFEEIYPDGSKQKIIADMDGETMYTGAYSYPDANKTVRDDYIDEILSLYSENESVWYKDFAVAFELKEGEKAIIRRNENGTDFNLIFNVTYGTGSSMHDEPYQNVFETSVPGQYAVAAYDSDGNVRFLAFDEIEIEIVAYGKKTN